MTGRVPDPERAPYDAARRPPALRVNPLTSPPPPPFAPLPLAPPFAPLPLAPPMAGSYAARDDELTALLDEDVRSGPSLPIVLLSAAFGVAAGVIALYVAYTVAKLRVEVSLAMAVLALCFAVGATGALLSAVIDSRAALPTIGLSCAVIVAAFAMFGLCMVVGAFAATLFITLGG